MDTSVIFNHLQIHEVFEKEKGKKIGFTLCVNHPANHKHQKLNIKPVLKGQPAYPEITRGSYVFAL